MSQVVNVDRKIVFKADANEQPNITGDMDCERMHFVEYWFDDTTSALWTETLDGTSDNIAPTAGGYPGLTLTTGTADNEVSFLGTALVFDITKNPVIETYVSLVDVSGTSFYFGFSDANTETSPASTIDYADGTLAAAAADAAGFVSDADKSSSLYYAAHIKTAGSVAGASTGETPTDNTWQRLRIKLDSSGNCTWYINDTAVYHKAAAVTDVPLCAVYNFGTRADDGSNVVYVRYFKAWQDI